jgi:dihydroorotase
MSAPRTLYRNVRLIDPEGAAHGPGWLLTEGNRIADLGSGDFQGGAPDDARIVDGAGGALAPGLIDMHALLCEPGAEHRETIASAGAAAAAGGITSIASLPNTSPAIDEPALIDFVQRRARESTPVNVYPMGALTKGCRGEEMAEIGLLSEAGAISFSDGNRTVESAPLLRRALSYASVFDALIVEHAEEPGLAATGVMNEGETAMRLGLAGIPAAAEVIAVERDIRLVELTGGRLHFAHLTCRAAVEAVRAAKARGLRITCGTAPHYLALTEEAVGEYRTFARVSPPLRGEDDRQALIEGLADGTIDVISSQHMPRDVESKRLPFSLAAPGVIGLETMLVVSLALHHEHAIELPLLLRAMTTAPAALLGLEQGRLARGAPADLVLFDENETWTIAGEQLRSKSKNTPFDEMPVRGRVKRTIAGGRDIYIDGEPMA